MFKKKKPVPKIDKDQLELFQNAQKRIAQKKRLYIHFVLFLIGSLFFIMLNLGLDFGKNIRPFEVDWFVYAILIWLFFLLYHIFNVFITHNFMGKAWEQKQLDKLMAKQQERIDKLEQELITNEKKTPETKPLNVSQKQKKQRLTIIVAAAENNAIGKDNMLIWHLSDDLKRFKNLTNGHHIIMGRKTFESFPKPLPNRTHVVVTRQPNYKVPEGVIVVNSLEDAMDASKKDPQPFIIGGGEIYKQTMPLTDIIELTRVHEVFEADAFFPEIDDSLWKEEKNTRHTKDENHAYDFSFITYIRR
ncbi:dihydrofolate reductase [Mariniflexile ostreae]|uniref:dihydrofolate reductase n=1 Tax=Mariniflexile ostreae TaxID=1520892 RepID=A0ABV5FA82_9FLAO